MIRIWFTTIDTLLDGNMGLSLFDVSLYQVIISWLRMYASLNGAIIN